MFSINSVNNKNSFQNIKSRAYRSETDPDLNLIDIDGSAMNNQPPIIDDEAEEIWYDALQNNEAEYEKEGYNDITLLEDSQRTVLKLLDTAANYKKQEIFTKLCTILSPTLSLS